MMGHYEILATAWAFNSLPKIAWITLGLFQVLFALGLVSGKKLPKLTFISTIGLMVISLLGTILYVSYKGSGVLWAIVPVIFLAVVAYGRRK